LTSEKGEEQYDSIWHFVCKMAHNVEKDLHICIYAEISGDFIIFFRCFSIYSYFSFIDQMLLLTCKPVSFEVDDNTLSISAFPDKCFRKQSIGFQTLTLDFLPCKCLIFSVQE
jgi:hypothetical protein